MKQLYSAAGYARLIQPDDEKVRANLERRLQRYAKEIPEDQQQKCDGYWAYERHVWDGLVAQERRAGRPKTTYPQAPE